MRTKKQNNSYRHNTIENGYHSHFYHQYFEDWSERVVRMPNGKTRIERFYAGDYYEMFSDREKLWRWKLMHCVLGCLGICLFLYGASRNTSGNCVWYVAIVQMFGLFCVLWNMISAIRTLPVKQQMTIREYKMTHAALETSCISGFALQGLTALLLIIFGVLNRNMDQAGILGIGTFLLNGCIYLGRWNMERKAVIKKIPQKKSILEEKDENTEDIQKEKGSWFRMGG